MTVLIIPILRFWLRVMLNMYSFIEMTVLLQVVSSAYSSDELICNYLGFSSGLFGDF